MGAGLRGFAVRTTNLDGVGGSGSGVGGSEIYDGGAGVGHRKGKERRGRRDARRRRTRWAK